MWKCLNIKSRETCYIVFDDDRKPFTNTFDLRLGYLTPLATMSKSMDTYSVWRTLEVATDTSNALHITLDGILKLVLTKCVVTVEFQREKIWCEFRIYRQLSVGNYHILVQQVLNCLNFQRLKLFNIFTLKQSSWHHRDSCCTEWLREHEIDALNRCIEESSNFNEIERSALYYMWLRSSQWKNIIINPKWLKVKANENFWEMLQEES